MPFHIGPSGAITSIKNDEQQEQCVIMPKKFRQLKFVVGLNCISWLIVSFFGEMKLLEGGKHSYIMVAIILRLHETSFPAKHITSVCILSATVGMTYEV